MTSIPYREFDLYGAAHRPEPQSSHPRRAFFRRLLDAFAQSQQQAAERDMARYARSHFGNSDRLTDEIERRLFEHLNDSRGFRP
jgi:hypothetical protein